MHLQKVVLNNVDDFHSDQNSQQKKIDFLFLEINMPKFAGLSL